MAMEKSDGGGEAAITERPLANEAETGTLKQRMEWLFENRRKPGDAKNPAGKKYSVREVARGCSVAPTTISRMLNGENTNPSIELLERIADFFGVDDGYFNRKASGEREQRKAKLDKALSDTGVEAIAMRSVGLTDKSVDAVLSMLDRVREMEGLPPVTDQRRESD